ncbi:MAG: enolase C-terminal domain-like protein [Candidatus Coatesbacteria bacterium]
MDHPPVVVASARCACEREPLSTPLGFKGGAQTDLWQTVVALRDTEGRLGVGLCTQGVLWSDREVFMRHGSDRGNEFMFAVLEDAARRAAGIPFSRPGQLLDSVLPGAIAKAKAVTGLDVRLTFVLNALVALDNAAWQLHARSHATSRLNNLLTAGERDLLSPLATRLTIIPLVGYAIPTDRIRGLVEDGHRLLKIKIGSDPEGDGDPEKMVRWDMRRVEEIHNAAGGDVLYYLDANGRYDSPDRLNRLLDHTRAIGAFDRIVLLEEPYPEELEVNVGDLGVRVAADESAHSDVEVRRRIALGYGAIALKPAAKTLSITLRMLAAATAARIPCFVADLTVSPILVDWNKAVAARLPALPGLDAPAFETNGSQYYANWTTMQSYHPKAGASWTEVRRGGFDLDAIYHEMTGGIFQPPEHYRKLAEGA